MTKLSRYPQVYAKILQTIPDDGTALTFTFASENDAKAERLKYYNFLRFCRRNPGDCAHFNGRYNRVVIRMAGSTLHFVLRPRTSAQTLEMQLAANTHVLRNPPETLPLSVPAGFDPDEFAGNDSPLAPPEEAPGQMNPLEVLEQALQEQARKKGE